MENLQFIATPDGFATATAPQPVPGPHDLLVAVEGFSVNPIDTKLHATLREPRVLGYDAVGTVQGIGKAVSDFAPGDRVVYAGTTQRPGSNQRLQLVATDLVAPVPAALPTPQLAALPLVGLTAWEVLFEKLGFTPAPGANAGRTLLVINGAGGVGTVMTQLARWAGITVLATASPAHHAWLTAHGVTTPLDYHQPLVPAVRATGHQTVDAIAILYAPEPYLAVASELIAPFGHIATIVTPTQPLDMAPLKPKSASFDLEYMFTKTDYDWHVASQGQCLRRLVALLAAGKLDPGVSVALSPITQANLEQATAQVAGGHTHGKVVVTRPWG